MSPQCRRFLYAASQWVAAFVVLGVAVGVMATWVEPVATVGMMLVVLVLLLADVVVVLVPVIYCRQRYLPAIAVGDHVV